MNPQQIPPQQPPPSGQPTQPSPPLPPSPELPQIAPPPPSTSITKPNRRFKLASLAVVPIGFVVFMILYALAAAPQKIAESSSDVEPTTQQAMTSENSYAQNTAQKNEAANMTASISEYITNNNGKLPANSTQLESALMSYASARDSEYTLTYKSSYSAADLPKDAYELYYFGGYTCDNNETVRTGSSRQFTIVYATVDGTQRCMTNV